MKEVIVLTLEIIKLWLELPIIIINRILQWEKLQKIS